jgi:hypothetical protein
MTVSVLPNSIIWKIDPACPHLHMSVMVNCTNYLVSSCGNSLTWSGETGEVNDEREEGNEEAGPKWYRVIHARLPRSINNIQLSTPSET